jgi:hypothetical protein
MNAENTGIKDSHLSKAHRRIGEKENNRFLLVSLSPVLLHSEQPGFGGIPR